MVQLSIAGHVPDLTEDHLADQSRRGFLDRAEIGALEGDRCRVLGWVQRGPGEQVGQPSPDVLGDSPAEIRFYVVDELDEPVMAWIETGQVEQLVHAVHGSEGESFVEPVIQLSRLGAGLGLRSDGVEHQVFGQNLEVEVAEKRHVGNSVGQLVDELGRRSGVTGGIAQGNVEEYGRAVQPGQHGAVELFALGWVEEALVTLVGAQVDGAEM
ncbi:hypothetical protein DVH02_10650 [Streptomyces corynorhini]|uniref:Uncharacterized protein n=1 Tax=Streptomyces corynorhini TaxID=2282652 RepID=A0A370BE98_9ACTN|nr:hypothetical protein DVH02_10650 [Streptomyces corynorhini]